MSQVNLHGTDGQKVGMGGIKLGVGIQVDLVEGNALLSAPFAPVPWLLKSVVSIFVVELAQQFFVRNFRLVRHLHERWIVFVLSEK